MKVALIIAGALLIPLTIAAGLVWAERRLLALFQDRYGPNRAGPFGLGQVLADVIKLFFKEDWIPPFADRAVFVLAPGILVATILLTFAVIPFTGNFLVLDSNIGILFFLGNSSLGVYSIVLGGWASNNKYSLLGSIRASAQMLTYEVFMGLSLVGVIMMANSFSLREIVEAQRNGWFFLPQFAGFVIFFIAGIAENHRTPFDIPEAEGELIAGYHSEYSGMKFAMFLVGEYLGITLISSLIVTLFFGGWLGPAFLPPAFWFFLKTSVFIFLFILIRAALPRLRYDQLMEVGWKIFLPIVLLNILITGGILLYRHLY